MPASGGSGGTEPRNPGWTPGVNRLTASVNTEPNKLSSRRARPFRISPFAIFLGSPYPCAKAAPLMISPPPLDHRFPGGFAVYPRGARSRVF